MQDCSTEQRYASYIDDPVPTLHPLLQKQRCPLHQAIVKGHTKVVEVLVNYDPGVVDCTDGVSHCHVIGPTISCASLLPQKRMQPLHLALKHRSAAMAVSLLSQQHCPVTWPDAVSYCTHQYHIHYNMILQLSSFSTHTKAYYCVVL